MKNIIIFICILFPTLSVSAQKWQQTIGQANQNESSMRVAEHYDKGYLISGSFGYSVDDGKGWLVKTDINGYVLWNKIIGVNPDNVVIGNTVLDDAGNLYVFGVLEQGPGYVWPVTIKLNACGEKQWCKLQYPSGFLYGFFKDAILLDNGDLLALAYMPTPDQFDMVYLFCFSPNGEYKWKKSYASRADHPTFDARSGNRIQQFGDMFIISGYVYSPHPGNPNIVSIRPMFIGIDTLFNEQWVLEFGLEDNMKGKAVESIAINDSTLMGVGRHLYGSNLMNAWAMIYNKDGGQINQQVFTNNLFNQEVSESTFYEVVNVNDSTFLATAGFYSEEINDFINGEVVFDTSGNVYNYNLRYESPASTYVDRTYDKKNIFATSLVYPDLTWDIYLYKINDSLQSDTIYTGSYNYDSLCTELPIQSGVIDLAGCDIITGIDEIPTLEEYNIRKNKVIISAYPNPSSAGSISISFENTEYFKDMELKCLDVFGNKVHSEKVYQYQGESKINISNWQKGIYIAIVYSNGLPVGRCKFVVQ